MNREPEQRDPWEDALDRAVKRLPDRLAPPTLVPRIRVAIAARKPAPWYRRSWPEWPAFPRAACLALSAGMVAALLWMIPPVDVTSFAPEWASASHAFLEAITTAHGTVFSGGVRIALILVAALFITMYLTCLGLGTAAFHVARRS